ncbi:hypothetical protein D3C78_1410110 [compost metagenome]
MLAIKQILDLLAVLPVQVDVLKTEYICFQLGQHGHNVTLHVGVTLSGDAGDLARRHRARHEIVVRILWRDPLQGLYTLGLHR